VITSTPKGTLEETITTVEAVMNAVWRMTHFETLMGDILKSLQILKGHLAFKEQQDSKVH